MFICIEKVVQREGKSSMISNLLFLKNDESKIKVLESHVRTFIMNVLRFAHCIKLNPYQKRGDYVAHRPNALLNGIFILRKERDNSKCEE